MTGFFLWRMSGFNQFPSQTFVAELDPRWVSDMQLALLLYEAQREDD